MPIGFLDVVEEFRLHAHEISDSLLAKRGELAGIEKERKGFVGGRMGVGIGHDLPPQLLMILTEKI